MATKKPGLVVDILAGGSSEEDAPPEVDAESPPPPPSGGEAETLIQDIQAQLDRLRSLMADL
jgi:hypothetical protein